MQLNSGAMETLKWTEACTSHPETIANYPFELLCARKFTDVVLSAGGEFLRAHQAILASGSDYFMNLFKQNEALPADATTPNVILCNMSFGDLCNIIEFIYTGSVAIEHDQLSRFTSAAKSLDVKGIEQFFIDSLKKKDTPVKSRFIPEPKPSSSKQENENSGTKKKLRDSAAHLESPKAQKLITSYLDPQSSSHKSSSKPLNAVGGGRKPKRTKCKFCPIMYENANTLNNHQRYCMHNSNRVESRCPYCSIEVPPGSMTYHKRKVHGYVTATKWNQKEVKQASSIHSTTSVSRQEMPKQSQEARAILFGSTDNSLGESKNYSSSSFTDSL